MAEGDTCPLFGYAKRGTRLYSKRSTKSRTRINTIATVDRHQRVIASLVYQATTTRDIFELYLEKALLKNLPRRAILILDNASFHKNGRIEMLCREFDIELLYLPPYSPELNPIEHFWAPLKAATRKYCQRFNLPVIDSMPLAYNSLSGSL